MFKQQHILLALAMVTALLLRIYYLLNVPLSAYEGDAFCRFQQAYENLTIYHSAYPGSLIWLPLHHYLLSVGMLFLPFPPFLNAQLIILVMGVASVGIVYWLAQLLFSRNAAVFSAWLLAINPFHCLYSVSTLSEVPFVFFSLLAFVGLYKYLKLPVKWHWLVVSSFAAACASWIRFDGYLLSLALPFILLLRQKNHTFFIGYLLMNIVPILLYAYISYNRTGYLFYGIHMSDLEVYYQVQATPKPLAQRIREIIFDFPISAFVLICTAVASFLAVVERKQVSYVLFCWMLIGLVAYKMLNNTLDSQSRYYSTGFLLLFPVVGYGLNWLIQKTWQGLYLPVFLLCGMLSVSSFKFQWQLLADRDLPYRQQYYKACKWLASNSTQNTKVVLGSNGMTLCGFSAFTGIDMSRIYFPHYPGMKKFDNYESFGADVMLRLLTNEEYTYIFCEKNSLVEEVINDKEFNQKIQVAGSSLSQAYKSDYYVIFRASK